MVIAYLNQFKFLFIKENGLIIKATQLGLASFSSSIPPEFALMIFNDISESRNKLILETDLHLLYLLTPHF
jgi:DNA polymerase theta